MIQRFSALLVSVSLALFCTSFTQAQIELTTNGDFETGDTSGWADFTGAPQTFDVSSFADDGSFAGEIFNPVEGTPAVVKQANLGIGVVNPGDMVTISFSASGFGEAGGVAFAEFFSEIDGGGTSASEILGGGPLFPPNGSYADYSFTAIAGPDVSGGVTLQFSATTGANIGSTSQLFIDNVSVSVVPEPTCLGLVSIGLLGLLGMRRRR